MLCEMNLVSASFVIPLLLKLSNIFAAIASETVNEQVRGSSSSSSSDRTGSAPSAHAIARRLLARVARHSART